MNTIEDLVIKCDNCNGITEWAECDKHEEADFSCYQITCLNCRWSQIDCDTTEHCKIIDREGERVMSKDCDCDNLDQDIVGYTCYKCYERGE